MGRNVGWHDRVVRIVIGTVMVEATITGLLDPWGYIGLVLLFSGILGRCPLYRILGVDSLATSQSKEHA